MVFEQKSAFSLVCFSSHGRFDFDFCFFFIFLIGFYFFYEPALPILSKFILCPVFCLVNENYLNCRSGLVLLCFSSSTGFLLRPYDITIFSNPSSAHALMQFQLNCLRDVIFTLIENFLIFRLIEFLVTCYYLTLKNDIRTKIFFSLL